MNGSQDPDERPSPREGSTTAAAGTPVAVDTSLDRRARTAITVFLIGPIVWATHFGLVYLIAEAGCTGDGPGLRVFNPPVPTIFTLAVTGVAALVCLACAWWAYRCWRSPARRRATGKPAQDRSRTEDHIAGSTLEFGGVILSLFSFVSVLMVGLPAMVLSPC